MKPRRVPTPPQVREMLLACPTKELRARGALEFLRAYTGATTGFIYLYAQDELSLAASSSGHSPPVGLVQEATRLWSSELDSHDDAEATLDLQEIEALRRGSASPYWRAEDGTNFYRFLLHTHTYSRWAPLGVVALQLSPNQPLPPVGRRHIDAICSALLKLGDAVPPED